MHEPGNRNPLQKMLFINWFGMFLKYADLLARSNQIGPLMSDYNPPYC